jgi:hypothetical protein
MTNNVPTEFIQISNGHENCPEVAGTLSVKPAVAEATFPAIVEMIPVDKTILRIRLPTDSAM